MDALAEKPLRTARRNRTCDKRTTHASTIKARVLFKTHSVLYSSMYTIKFEDPDNVLPGERKASDSSQVLLLYDIWRAFPAN